MAEKTEFLITARDETGAAFAAVESGLGKISRALGGLLAPIAALTSAAGFGALVKHQIDLGDQLSKTSQKIGVAVEDLSAYQYAARLSDVSNEQLTSGLARLTKAMGEAAGNSSSQAARAFQALGVSVTDTAGNLRPINAVLDEVAEKFAATRDGTNKTAMAMEVFGRSGAELVPLLNSLRELSGEARRTGNIVSTEFAKKSEQLNDSLTRLSAAAGNFGRTLAGVVVPALASMIERLNVAIGAQESLSLGLLKKDKEFLQVEYKALMDAAEKGYIINTNRAEFLKKQIDEIDAKINAAQQKAAAATPAATEALPEMAALVKLDEVTEKRLAKEAEFTVRYTAELQKQLEVLYFKNTSEIEALNIKYAEQQALLDMGFSNGLVSEQLYYEQSALLKVQHEEMLAGIEKGYLDARAKENANWRVREFGAQNAWMLQVASLMEGSFNRQLQGTSIMLGKLSGMMLSSKKKEFEIGKKAAIGQALIDTYLAAANALTISPFFLGLAMAAIAVGVGMANVNRIRSQKFGGGGGATPTFNASPGGIPSPESMVPDLPAPTAPSLPQSQTAAPRNVNITLISQTGMLSTNWVREELVPALNEAVGDGVNLRVTS